MHERMISRAFIVVIGRVLSQGIELLQVPSIFKRIIAKLWLPAP